MFFSGPDRDKTIAGIIYDLDTVRIINSTNQYIRSVALQYNFALKLKRCSPIILDLFMKAKIIFY